MIHLYNTLTRKIEQFQPSHPPIVTQYTCGPTVYDYSHIGHMRTYVAHDILKRALLYNEYTVKHVMNITDVGHLTGEDDTGEDKLEKGAQKLKKSVWDVARFFTDQFFYTMDQLNISRPDIVCRATDHINSMIELIARLEKKGLLYETDEAVYFDTTLFPKYGKLSGQKKEHKLVGVRQEVVIDAKKKHPVDFVVWFKRVGKFANHTMHWDSPWGDGFPGWHIECSAMSMKYLGETIDIHGGAVDHIAVHHENEIAQSEGATGKPFVRFWFHGEFLMIEGEKMSKSLNNFYTIDDIKKRGIHPLALRYLFLQSYYRTQMNFTWDSAVAANKGYYNLLDSVSFLKKQTHRQNLSVEKLSELDAYRYRFNTAIADDLQTPAALAVTHELIKSNIPSRDKYDLLLEFDRIFGFGLDTVIDEKIPDDIFSYAEKRKKARDQKDFNLADELRLKIEESGYMIEDKNESFFLKKSPKTLI